MFAPDGRNSIQYTGHLAATAVKYLCMVFALACIAPVYLYITGRQTMETQQGAIQAFNADPDIQNITIDFNAPTFRVFDANVYQAWAAENPVSDADVNSGLEKIMDPSLQSLPFTATSSSRIIQPARAFPKENINLATWIYYNLPFEQGVVHDSWQEQALAVGLAPYPFHADVISAYDHQLETNNLYNPEVAKWDPWMSQGLYKMAPTKWWDWYTGQELVQAKSSYNYSAYVFAARVCAGMRFLIAHQAVPSVSAINSPVPARVMASIPKSSRDAFATIYRNAFKGKLPVVYIQAQHLSDEVLLKQEDFAEWNARSPQNFQRYAHFTNVFEEGSFITGMSLSADPKMTGRPEYSYGDFFYSSTPSLNPTAEKAQKALMALQSFEFWAPLLKAEGANGSTLSKAAELLTQERSRLSRDKHFAKMHGHEVYKHETTL